jgi:hypothetical protein
MPDPSTTDRDAPASRLLSAAGRVLRWLRHEAWRALPALVIWVALVWASEMDPDSWWFIGALMVAWSGKDWEASRARKEGKAEGVKQAITAMAIALERLGFTASDLEHGRSGDAGASSATRGEVGQ